jgi:hypothetical protein
VETRFRLLIAFYLLALGISLTAMLLSLVQGALLVGLFFLLGAIAMVFILRAPVMLLANIAYTKALLALLERHDLDTPDDYFEDSIVFLRLAALRFAKMRWALAGTNPRRHTRELQQRIAADLDTLEKGLRQLATAYSLGGEALLARVTLRSPFLNVRLANRQLAICQAAFPQAVAEQASQQPGLALVTALGSLCMSITANPLSVEVFATGGQFMAELHRDDLADLLQAMSRHLSEMRKRQIARVGEIQARFTRDAPEL